MNRKIMVVDDEYEVADIVKKMLESEGYDVITANSGEECLKKLEKERPDLILLDIMMPVMDGWTTLRKIKSNEKWRSIPVSMLTALPLTPDDTKDKPINSIENYIVKPFSKKILVQKVRDILDREKEINEMYEKIKKEVGEAEAEEYKRLSFAVSRHRRLIGVIVDSTVVELKESIKNLVISQKRMIDAMNKKIKEIEDMTEEALKKKQDGSV